MMAEVGDEDAEEEVMSIEIPRSTRLTSALTEGTVLATLMILPGFCSWLIVVLRS